MHIKVGQSKFRNVLVRATLIGCLALFLGGMTLQLSLLYKISQHHRNATSTTIHDPIGSQQQQQQQQQLPSSTATTPISQQELGRCAINLFGLPRAFESLVLPSLLKNVIQREY